MVKPVFAAAQLREEVRELIPHGGERYFRIADLGCGIAPLLPALLEQSGGGPFTYRGFDISPSIIAQAKRRYAGLDADIAFDVLDIARLDDATEFAWNNVIILRDVLAREGDIVPVCEYISKTLVNDGVFYVRMLLSPQPDMASGAMSDQTLSQIAEIERRFESEGVYQLRQFESVASDGSIYANLIGKKSTHLHFAKYRYAFGYHEALRGLDELLTPYANAVTHFGDNDLTFRHEGYLRRMAEADFRKVMDILCLAVNAMCPGRFPIYLKDKLNIQHFGARFIAHQDATAGWNERIGEYEYLTFGLPLQNIPDASHGATRIAIRQDYQRTVIRRRPSDITETGVEAMPALDGHQFLNCLAVPGTYYAYDQYVVHDSSANTSDRIRRVLFVTCILSDQDESYSRSIAHKFAPLLETRPGLDVRRKRGHATREASDDC